MGQILDSFIGIIKSPEVNLPRKCSFTELKRSFDATNGLSKSLLVIHVENGLSECEEDVSACSAHQERVLQQLLSVCGRHADGAAIGNKEYAVLLHDIDQCGELIPRLENLLSRTAAGHLNGDGVSLHCRIGVARSPLDADELRDMIRLASTVAAEISHGELGYHFFSRATLRTLGVEHFGHRN